MQSRLSILVIGVAILGGALGGWLARECALLDGQQFTLDRSLELSASIGQPGRLPAGTTMYEFRVMPETSTFIVFVNTKRRDSLQLITGGERFAVKPIDAY